MKTLHHEYYGNNPNPRPNYHDARLQSYPYWQEIQQTSYKKHLAELLPYYKEMKKQKPNDRYYKNPKSLATYAAHIRSHDTAHTQCQTEQRHLQQLIDLHLTGKTTPEQEKQLTIEILRGNIIA